VPKHGNILGLGLILIRFSVISAFTMFVAITFPFFGGLLGFFGGFAFAPTTYFVSLNRPSKTKKETLYEYEILIQWNAFQQRISYQCLLFPVSFFSSLASCGLPSTNQRSLAYLGVPTGYVQLKIVPPCLHCILICFTVHNQFLIGFLYFRSALYWASC
jgi:hypothetical protein